jgi:hypothetical protein
VGGHLEGTNRWAAGAKNVRVHGEALTVCLQYCKAKKTSERQDEKEDPECFIILKICRILAFIGRFRTHLLFSAIISNKL